MQMSTMTVANDARYTVSELNFYIVIFSENSDTLCSIHHTITSTIFSVVTSRSTHSFWCAQTWFAKNRVRRYLKVPCHSTNHNCHIWHAAQRFLVDSPIHSPTPRLPNPHTVQHSSWFLLVPTQIAWETVWGTPRSLPCPKRLRETRRLPVQ